MSGEAAKKRTGEKEVAKAMSTQGQSIALLKRQMEVKEAGGDYLSLNLDNMYDESPVKNDRKRSIEDDVEEGEIRPAKKVKANETKPVLQDTQRVQGKSVGDRKPDTDAEAPKVLTSVFQMKGRKRTNEDRADARPEKRFEKKRISPWATKTIETPRKTKPSMPQIKSIKRRERDEEEDTRPSKKVKGLEQGPKLPNLKLKGQSRSERRSSPPFVSKKDLKSLAPSHPLTKGQGNTSENTPEKGLNKACKSLKRKAEEDLESSLKRPKVEAAKAPKPMGLTNRRLGCFINASLQCLRKIGPLCRRYGPMKHAVLSMKDILAAEAKMTASQGKTISRSAVDAEVQIRSAFQEISDDDFQLSPFLGHILDRMTAGNDEAKGSENQLRTASPALFALACGRLFPQFDAHSQEDPAQFIETAMGRLIEEELLSPDLHAGKEASDSVEDDKPLAESLLRGEWGHMFHCEDCGYKQDSPDPFWTLQLPVTKQAQPMGLQACLKGVMNREEAHTAVCGKCGVRGRSTITTHFKKAPENLIIHLSRASMEGKVFTKVDIPLDAIDLTVCAPECIPGDPSAKYELFGMIKHQGQTTQAGHYIAYVKQDDDWWEANDARVKKVAAQEVQDNENEQPYLLFMKRTSTSTTSNARA